MTSASIAALILVHIAAPNPVLPDVADAGVLRHAGRYYIMGVGTAGGIHVSEDLVQWSKAVPGFTMANDWATGAAGADREIHACDLVLDNGWFHLYWSVNHGALRQIGHAVGDSPLGPYVEPIRSHPFDGRIDPQFFRDEGGQRYFYTVKFGLGNVIWGQRMRNAWTLQGKPKPLLRALPDTWETLDQPQTRINEGPFVSKYRERYYLLYNANHTGREFGNYALGAAESDSPLGFDDGTKYPFPVLRSNRDPAHADRAVPIAVPEAKNCGQPNLVRGPNGFEWWLVYFADHARRSQCIDRVHFFGHELFVEGPTVAGQAGYHPVPALPGFAGHFHAAADRRALWRLSKGWEFPAGALRAAGGTGMRTAMADAPPGHSYVVEATFACGASTVGSAGVVAWDDGQGNAVRLGVDREHTAWVCSTSMDGVLHEEVSPLSGDWNWSGPHSVRIENNASAITAWLDGVIQPGFTVPQAHYRAGQPGLFADMPGTHFEYFSTTRGWDEWGAGIRGWLDEAGAIYTGGRRGLTLRAGQHVTKGDAMACYELAVQARVRGEGGIDAVWVNDDNHLRLNVDSDGATVRVSGRRAGQPLPEQRLAVHPRLQRAQPAGRSGLPLRVVKRADRAVLFADGLEIGSVEGPWPAARVGFFAAAGHATFDGILVYELP